MKVIVDRSLCESNQICVRVCPQLFSIDDNDMLVIAKERVAPELLDRVSRAVKGCPRQALRLVEDE